MGKEVLKADTAPKRMYSSYFGKNCLSRNFRKHIEFGILEPHQIDEVSEVEIVNRELYSIADRQPVKHGVLDRRLVRNLFWRL